MYGLRWLAILGVLLSVTLATAQDGVQIPDGTPYAIGQPVMRDVYIDPENGDDNADGSASTPWRTLDYAWRQLPMGETLSQGYRMILRAGDYSAENIPTYWESRYGTADSPIILTSESGADSVRLPNVNMFDVRYFYVLDITMAGGGDVFHCERCDHLLLRGVTVIGDEPETYNTQETIKINQSQWVSIENSDISGAWDNALDAVAVQYGQLIDSRIHNAGDWCTYVKGGSYGWYIGRNEFFDCGTGGVTAGQGTGFEFMTAPWWTYEAADITITQNLIHDTEGAAFGVNGGDNILIANNIAYRVGARSHVLEVAHGLRSCDGDTEQCTLNQAAGGWGPTTVGVEMYIPSRRVHILNNVIENPSGAPSQWQQFFIAAPRTPAPTADPARADDGLVIAGNIIINGSETHPLGIEDGGACADTNPTCNAAQLRRDNQINTLSRALVDPENGDFRLLEGVELPPMPIIP